MCKSERELKKKKPFTENVRAGALSSYSYRLARLAASQHRSPQQRCRVILNCVSFLFLYTIQFFRNDILSKRTILLPCFRFCPTVRASMRRSQDSLRPRWQSVIIKWVMKQDMQMAVTLFGHTGSLSLSRRKETRTKEPLVIMAASSSFFFGWAFACLCRLNLWLLS